MIKSDIKNMIGKAIGFNFFDFYNFFNFPNNKNKRLCQTRRK